MPFLADITSNPILRNFAQGAAQSAVRPVADFLAPTVSVPTQYGRFKKFTQQYRFKIPNTVRPINGKAFSVGFDANDEQYNCVPNALDFPIDNLEQLEAEQLMSIAKYGATLIADVSTLAHEAAVINAALAALGGGTETDFTNAALDPVATIDAQIIATIKAAMNGAPIRVLFGAGAFLEFKNHPLVRARFIVGEGAPLGVVKVGIEDVGSLLFGNPQVAMTTMVQDVSAAGLAPNVQFILDKKVIVFAAQNNPTTLDPSFMKTFRLDGQWMVPGSYVKEDGRGEVLKMDWSEQIQVTNSAAGSLLALSA